MAIQTCDEWNKALLGITALQTVLTAGRIRLFDVAHAPLHTSVPADFHEATFAGYAAVVPAVSAGPISDGGTGFQLLLARATFTLIGAGPVTLYGYEITDSANLKLYMAEQFAAPITLDITHPTLLLDISIDEKPQI
jgi:hypothetical protein